MTTMQAFLKLKNPLFPHIAEHYTSIAPGFGLDPQVLFFHAVLCTDWFRTARASMNDFCFSGLDYPTVEAGVTAQCEAVKARGISPSLLSSISSLQAQFEAFAQSEEEPPVVVKPVPPPARIPAEQNKKGMGAVVKTMLTVVTTIIATLAVLGWLIPAPVRAVILTVLETIVRPLLLTLCKLLPGCEV